MLAFANRMTGPPVQIVTQIDSFDMLKSQHDLFFTYVGQRNSSLWYKYYHIAEHFQPHAFFYATNRELAIPHFQIDTLPTVLVYKESSHYHFPCKHILTHMAFVFFHGFLLTFSLFPFSVQ